MQKVACGVMLTEDNNVLLGQRNSHGDNPGYWEFPGGKCEEGETIEECLCREWKEELNLNITIENEIFTNITDNYKCYFFIGYIKNLDDMEINVHARVKLCQINELYNMKLFEGDEKIIPHIFRYIYTR